MAEAALVIYAFYLGSAFLWRSWTQWRATGSSGSVGIRGRPGSLEWLAGVLSVGALALGLAAPVLALAGMLEPLAVPDTVALVGFVALLAALELQVRVVEEPYLVRTHGSGYLGYAARVGRFFPGIGTLREPRT